MDCVFCWIIAGTSPARFVAQAADVVAFHPLNPVVPGHILVVPRLHVADFREDPDVTAEVMKAAAQLAEHLPSSDCNLITSAGSSATQTVFHLHVHLVPRRPGDGLRLPWSPR